MKILVTGATGFIGQRFVESILPEGNEIFSLVRKTSKVDFLKKAGISLITADIADREEVEKVFSEVRPDVTVHCSASVTSGDEDELYKANVVGTENICSACLKYCTDRLVYLSSVSVVSGNTETPLRDDMPYKATSAYGRSKIEAEKKVLRYRDKGLRAVVLRPCMVYGEEEPHALDKILRRVSKRLVPVISMPGVKDKLHLAYIDNVVDAMRLAMGKPQALSGTFIIADREIISIRKFIEILSDELGAGKPFVIPVFLVKTALIVPFIRKKFNRIFKDRIYDISRAVSELGYDPKISTEEALRKTARYWGTPHLGTPHKGE